MNNRYHLPVHWHRINFSLLRCGESAVAYLEANDERLRLATEAAQLAIEVFDLQSAEHTWFAELKRIFGLCDRF